MKYIKSFENESETFNIGDYVKIKNSYNSKGKIETLYTSLKRAIIHDEINKWRIPQYYKDIRLMTPEEIEQYELELKINKYNL